MEIKCQINSCISSEDELHHIIPKNIEGTDNDGRIYLCKKHHDIIHKMIPLWIFKYVPLDRRQECYAHIKRNTKWFKENFPR